MKLKKATLTDIPFLVEAVVAAETLPSGKCLYEKLFRLSPTDLQKRLATILKTEGGGFPLSYETFYVLWDGETRVATCAAWIEKASGIASNLLMAKSWQSCLEEKWDAAEEGLRVLGRSHISRTPGMLQLETFYVVSKYRGKRVTSELIQLVRKEFPEVSAEIEFLSFNQSARRAYARSGFQVAAEKKQNDPVFIELAETDGFVMFRGPKLS